jgi:hypothetical protein
MQDRAAAEPTAALRCPSEHRHPCLQAFRNSSQIAQFVRDEAPFFVDNRPPFVVDGALATGYVDKGELDHYAGSWVPGLIDGFPDSALVVADLVSFPQPDVGKDICGSYPWPLEKNATTSKSLSAEE